MTGWWRRLEALPALIPGWTHAAILALLVALAWALLARLLRRPNWAGAAAGAGLLAGAVLLLPLPGAWPRSLPDRLLPLLAALWLLGVGLPRLGRAGPVAAGVALVAAAWWLAGAPLRLPDGRRAAPAGGAAAVGGLLFLRALGVRAAEPVAAVGFAAALAGLWIAGAAGLATGLALAGLGASLGGWAGRAPLGWPSRLVLAGGLAASLALLLAGRAAPVDWAAAAAPAAALLPGVLGRARPPLAAAAAAALAAVPPLLAAWWLRG
ncbi:hypothetical protein [Roseomonas sp. BN140053]|uniref:hypothetical protein n=1 Tax=Roseomonas sp. BN140053 TaxID=3391898 RepID=UPI0039E8773A